MKYGTYSPPPPWDPLWSPGDKTEESFRLRKPMMDGEWDEACSELRVGLTREGSERMAPVARGIAEGIAWLEPIMEELCRITCPPCHDRCCTGQRVFYNEVDLLYLLALGKGLPPGQTRSHPCEPCRYLGEVGCGLERVRRPYVCTWFLCGPQMEWLQEQDAHLQRDLIRVLQGIRTGRLLLEHLYTCPPRMG